MMSTILAFRLLFGNVKGLKATIDIWCKSGKISEIDQLAYDALVRSLENSVLDKHIKAIFRTIFSTNYSQLLSNFRKYIEDSGSFAEIFTIEFENKLTAHLEDILSKGNYDLDKTKCRDYIQEITAGFCKVASDERSEKQGIQILIEKANELSSKLADLAESIATIHSAVINPVKIDEQFLNNEKNKTTLELVKKTSKNAINLLRSYDYQAGIDLLEGLIQELNKCKIDAIETYASLYTNIAIGYLYLNQQGKYYESIIKALECGNPSSNTILNAYWAYSATGYEEKAEEMFKILKGSHSMSEDFYSAKLDKIDELDSEAEDFFKGAKRLFPDSAEISYRIAQVYLKHNMIEEFSQEMDQVVMKHPDSLVRVGTQHAVRLQYEICNTIKLGSPVEINSDEKLRLEKAAKLYMEIWSKLKNSSSSKTYAPHLINLSNIYYTLGKKDESLKYLQIAHELIPSDFTSSRTMVWHFLEGDFTKAIIAGSQISNIFNLEMKESLVVYVQILMNSSRENKELALSIIEKAIEKRPSDEDLLYIKGIALLLCSDSQEALKWALKLQENAPTNARFHIIAAKAYKADSNIEEAIKSIEKAVNGLVTFESPVKSDLLRELWEMKEYHLLFNACNMIGESELDLHELQYFEFALGQLNYDRHRFLFYIRMMKRFEYKRFTINYWNLLDKYRDYNTGIDICQKHLVNEPNSLIAKIDLCQFYMKSGKVNEAESIDLKGEDSNELDYTYFMRLMTQLLFFKRYDQIVGTLYSRYRRNFDHECTDIILQTYIACGFKEEEIFLAKAVDNSAIIIINTFSKERRVLVLQNRGDNKNEYSDEVGPGHIIYDNCIGQALGHTFKVKSRNQIMHEEEYEIIAVHSIGKYLFDIATSAAGSIHKEESSFYMIQGENEDHLKSMLDSILKLDKVSKEPVDRSIAYQAYLNMQFPSGMVIKHYQLHSFVFYYTLFDKLGEFPDRANIYQEEIVKRLGAESKVQYCIDITGIISLYKSNTKIGNQNVHVSQSTVDLIRLMTYNKDNFQSNSWNFRIDNNDKVLLETNSNILNEMIVELPNILLWIEQNLQQPQSAMARLDFEKKYIEQMEKVIDPSIVDTMLLGRKLNLCVITDDYMSGHIEMVEGRNIVIDSEIFKAIID
ncbi:MAG: tetratricopeptide (TPR) repeat protein [Halioglobus sp.]|jgi:tetratricopeptide (TPR) repeat protein